MSVLYISGFETGDTREWSGPGVSVAASQAVTISGGYVYAVDASVASNQVNNTVSQPFSVTEAYGRCRFYFTSTGSPTVARRVQILNLETNEPTHVATVYMNKKTDGTHTLQMGDYNTLNTTGLEFSVSANTEYVLELYAKIGASGGASFRLNGITQDSSKFDGGSVNICTPRSGNSASVTGSGSDTLVIYVDDFCVRDDSWPGPSRVLARQGTAGTPTYNSWTKTGLSTAALNWSETPFSATNNCNQAGTTAVAQTMLVASFFSTQAGHGTEVLKESDQINGANVSVIAKTSSTANGGDVMSIRRRINSVDTDSSITFTGTTDKFFRTAIFTTTPILLSSMEAGGVHGVTGVSITQTIEDAWVMADVIAMDPYLLVKN